jgi:hypothetical protein
MTEIVSMRDDELMSALASALLDADDAAFEAAAARIRGMFHATCAVYAASGAPAVAEPGDYDRDGNGGLLWLRIPPRPARLIDGCPDMTRLADDGYGGAL